MKKFLTKIQSLGLTKSEWYLLFSPIFIWLSYLPLLHFSKVSGANVELSLLEIYLVGLVIINLPNIFRNLNSLRQNKIVWLTGLVVILSTLSLFWTSNLSRGLLTLGVEFVLFGVFLSFLSMKRFKLLMPYLIQIYIFSAVIMSFLALIQVIYGTWIDFGLCRGCLAAGFGFVRPSLFTAEPQFLGSLLIAPILILAYRLSARKWDVFGVVSLSITSLALYLTLSRGAIYAVVIGLIVLAFISYSHIKKYLLVLVIILGSFILGMMVHATSAQFNPHIAGNFYDSISKSVNHLSMGLVSLPAPKISEPITVSEQPKAVFDGYVAKSTDERVNMTSLGLQTWTAQPKTVLIGVGIGGSGQSILDYTGKISSSSEIIQNQYIEILLEKGIIGFVLFGVIIGWLFYTTRHKKVVWAILVAFLLQWNMFSGYPNALHAYLIIAALLCYYSQYFTKKKYKAL